MRTPLTTVLNLQAKGRAYMEGLNTQPPGRQFEAPLPGPTQGEVVRATADALDVVFFVGVPEKPYSFFGGSLLRALAHSSGVKRQAEWDYENSLQAQARIKELQQANGGLSQEEVIAATLRDFECLSLTRSLPMQNAFQRAVRINPRLAEARMQQLEKAMRMA